jgi:restriction endonuclease SmaI-like protein
MDLSCQLARLSPSQIALIASMARALEVPVKAAINPTSDIVDEAFSEAVSNLLTLHHALHEEPLNKKSFEYLFKQCLTASGRQARLNPNPGDSAWDVEGAGFRWSLKTEAARGISAASIKVEKLMEARWVRDAVTPEQAAEGVRTVLTRHMEHYERILVLRAFGFPDGYSYFLEEMPVDLLREQFAQVAAGDVAKKGKAISYGIDFRDKYGEKIFRILLDSSVEKIRLWFQASHSVRHGSWHVRVGDVQEVQQESMVN